MASKADKLLGIKGKLDKETKIEVQHFGELHIKENEKRTLNNAYKKRWCVVKDGFFLWYNSNTQNGFDRKPKGIFPLNGAWINHDTNADDGRVIELIHPDIARANFLLRADSKITARDWFLCFESSKKATWENAQLGVAMLDQIKKGGEKLKNQKSDAVKELEEKVARLEKENQEKLRIVEREMKQENKFKQKMLAEEQKLKERTDNLENIEKMIEAEEKVHQEAAQKRKSLEMKLSMANMALRRLETAFMEEFKEPEQKKSAVAEEIGNQVAQSVAALRGFFEDTIKTHREKQKRYVGRKLVEIQQTLGRKKKN